jgi:hypothetical protein
MIARNDVSKTKDDLAAAVAAILATLASAGIDYLHADCGPVFRCAGKS